MVNRIANKILRILKMDAIYGLYKHSQLRKDGWFRSYLDKKPYDGKGNLIPWFTYSAMYFLSSKINSSMKVFEYGCGGSTIWWASHAKEVISCEHDNIWHQKISEIIPENVTLFLIELDSENAYSKKITEYNNRFDIIVLDGRDRVNCAYNVINALKCDGVIIWDNSDRDIYMDGYNYLLNNGFKRLDFYGMGPINLYSWSTSIFYRKSNCLGI